MDNAIQIATVLAAFAAVHERVIELLQQLSTSRARPILTLGGQLSWSEESAIAWKNSLLAIVLAFASRANFLELFQYTKEGRSVFFVNYMNWTDAPLEWWLSPQTIVGCVLMGLSTGLGSKFWHDLTSGLTDLRDRAKEVAAAAAGLHPARPPPQPPPDLGVQVARG